MRGFDELDRLIQEAEERGDYEEVERLKKERTELELVYWIGFG